MNGEKCKQEGCELFATFRYTWPGKDESFICLHHAPKLRSVASAIGLCLQLVPLYFVEHTNEP